MQTKAIIRQQLLPVLADPISKIRVAVAHIISLIASSDWPHAWPNLVDLLLHGLKASDPNLVHGVLRVLSGKFYVDDVISLHLHLFPTIFACILNEI